MARFIRNACLAALVVGTTATPAFAQTDDLSLLPVDSELVAGLDFQQLQSSALWRTMIAPKLMTGSAKKQLDEFKANCGLDAMKVVTKIAIGIKGLGNDKPDGVIVAHGVPKAKLIACYDKMSKLKKPDQDIKRDGDVLLVHDKNGQNVAFTFVDNTTALMVVGTKATTAGIKAIARGRSALRKSAAFSAIYGKTKTSHTLWLIMNGNSKAFDSLAGMGIKPKALYGSLNVTKNLHLDLRMQVDSPDQAKTIANMLSGQIKAMAAMVDKVNVAASGADVVLTVMLSDAKLKALAKQFGPRP